MATSSSSKARRQWPGNLAAATILEGADSHVHATLQLTDLLERLGIDIAGRGKVADVLQGQAIEPDFLVVGPGEDKARIDTIDRGIDQRGVVLRHGSKPASV